MAGVAHFCSAFLLFAALVFAAGCRSTGRMSDQAPQAESFMLSAEQEDFADALANFGAGIVRENLRDPGAVSNYSNVATLDPGELLPHVHLSSYLLKTGKPDEAIELLRSFAENNPDSFEARLWLGRIYMHAVGVRGMENDYKEKAETFFRSVMETNPHIEDGYLHLASFYAAEGREADAEAVLKQAADQLENPVNVLRMHGDMMFEQSLSGGTNSVAALDKAIALFEKAEQCPADDLTDVYLEKLAESYVRADQPEEAAQCYYRLYDRNPGELRFIRAAGLVRDATGDKHGAIKAFELVVSNGDARYSEVYHRLGELYVETGNNAKALKLYEQAEALFPEDVRFYVKQAHLYADDDLDRALESIHRGLDAVPDSIQLLEINAHLLMAKDEPEKALEIYSSIESAIKETPSLFPAPLFYLNYGAAAEGAGKPDKALELYRKAIAMDPAMDEAYLQSALIHARRKNELAALTIMDILVKSDKDNPKAYYYLGIINNRLERFEQALESFYTAEMVATASGRDSILEDPAFYFNYGAAAERIQNFEEAERLFEKAISLDPDNHEAYNYLAYMWAEQGVKLEKALEYVNRALELLPDNGAYLDTLGWIYYKQGRFDDALNKLLEAFDYMPGDPVIADHVGDTYKKSGNMEKAVEFWKISLEHKNEDDVRQKLIEAGVVPDDLE